MKDSTEYVVQRTLSHLCVSFDSKRRVLSSAVLNGGLTDASHIINIKVDGNPSGSPLEPPHQTILRYARDLGLNGEIIGMMTAASMNSFRSVEKARSGAKVAALVTAGLSNAKRAGEPAEYRSFEDAPQRAGTINMIIITNVLLSQAAMVEAVITATEAKSAALEDIGVMSATSGGRATGTGTDSVAIVNGHGPIQAGYCGKHVILGEMIATAVIEAVTDSLKGGKCCD